MALFSHKKAVEDTNISQQLLEAAHIQAEKIIERALEKSEQIVDELDKFREDMKKEMKMIFRQSADSYIHTITGEANEFAKACEELLPQVKDRYMKGLDTYLEVFKNNLSQELIPVRTVVDTRVKESTDQLKKRMDEEWIKVQREIQDYKQTREKQMEQLFTEKIEMLAKQTFGKSLTVQQHQQLVMNALETAKKEGVFK